MRGKDAPANRMSSDTNPSPVFAPANRSPRAPEREPSLTRSMVRNKQMLQEIDRNNEGNEDEDFEP